VFEACGLLFVVFAVQEVAVSLGSLQVVDVPMLWTFTTVHRAHGRLRSSVWRAIFLLQLLLGTWPSLRGVTQVIAVFTLFVEGLLFCLMRVGDGVTFACLRRGACCLLCLRCRRLPSDGGHLQIADVPMLWTCTTVHRAHGRLRSSVGRALVLLQHLLGTWPSSWGVTQVIAVFTLFVEGLLVWADACGRWCDVCVFEARGLLFVVFAEQEVAV
jgi:hypothetical protein